METSKLLSIAKEILDLNDNASLTGTLMLKLRGIDLGRDAKDIDICSIKPENIAFPKGSDKQPFKYDNEEDYNNDTENEIYRFTIKSNSEKINVDCIYSDKDYDIVNGIKLAKVEDLMQAKYEYSLQDYVSASKHHEDLIKMGFKFPENNKTK